MPNDLAASIEEKMIKEARWIKLRKFTVNETDLFRVLGFVLFLRTNGLYFNILKVTKPLKREKLGPN